MKRVLNKSGELGESPNEVTWVTPSQACGHPHEGVETTGGKTVCLNDQQERPTPQGDDIVRPMVKAID